jgi:hypothetical protein
VALQFSTSYRNLLIGRGIRAAFTTGAANAITIYGGVQPTADNIAASWATYNASFLAHYQGASWTQPSNGLLLQLGIPTAVVAAGTGTATWAILWNANHTQVTIQGATLPSINFMVVPCSNSIGTGVIRFTTTAMNTGVSAPILDGSIGAYML